MTPNISFTSMKVMRRIARGLLRANLAALTSSQSLTRTSRCRGSTSLRMELSTLDWLDRKVFKVITIALVHLLAIMPEIRDILCRRWR